MVRHRLCIRHACNRLASRLVHRPDSRRVNRLVSLLLFQVAFLVAVQRVVPVEIRRASLLHGPQEFHLGNHLGNQLKIRLLFRRVYRALSLRCKVVRAQCALLDPVEHVFVDGHRRSLALELEDNHARVVPGRKDVLLRVCRHDPENVDFSNSR